VASSARQGIEELAPAASTRCRSEPSFVEPQRARTFSPRRWPCRIVA